MSASAVPEVIPALGAAGPDDNPYGPGFEPARPGHYLLAIDPQQRPYKVNVPREYSAYFPIVSLLRVCVSEAGTVHKVAILKPTIPIVDMQIPNVIARWRYHPYFYNGQPVPWCYELRYRISDCRIPPDAERAENVPAGSATPQP